MSISKSKSIFLCSLIGGLAALSGCSDKKAKDASINEIDRSNLSTDVISNGDLSASDTEWTGWKADVDVTDGALAEFAVDTTTLPSNSLRTSVINVEASNAPAEIQAGPVSVPVEPGKVYGVGAFVRGTRCGLGKFVVHEAGDPENVLAEQEFFFSGELQSLDYSFEVPASGVTSVEMPLQLAFADNIGGEFFIDKMLAVPNVLRTPGAEGNVAHNSNFELSDTSINVTFGTPSRNSWENRGPATFTLDTDEAQDGNNSVRIDFASAGSGNAYDIEAGPVNVPVTPGWTYTFSAWIKGDAGAKANFLIQLPGTPYTVYNEQSVIVTEEWQEVRFEATITDTEVVRLYAQYNFPENSGKTIYIDNIKLIPPDTCPYAAVAPNLVSENDALFEYDHVTNGGFEESGSEAPGWLTQADATLASFDVQVTEPTVNRSLVNTGNNSLKATIDAVGANAWDIQAGPTDLFVTPGQTYIYSGFARSSAGAKATFAAALQDAPNDFLEGYTVTFPDVLWHQMTFDFNIPADAPVLTPEELEAAGLAADSVVTRVRMLVNMSYPENVGRRIFLDDFTFLPNAATNGDLEDSTTEALGWTWQPSDDAVATFALSNEEAHTGNNSLKVSVGEIAEGASINLWDIQAGIADISVEGGRKYFISTRIKGDEGTRAKILLDLAEDPYTEYASAGGQDSNDDDTRADGIAITEEWQEVTFVANIPAGVESVRLLAQLGFIENSGKAIYLDSFKLVSQIPPPPPPPKAESANIVTNGGLETSKADGWNANNAQIAVTRSPEGIYSGNYGLYVSGRTLNWHSAQYNLLDAGLEEGSTYMASVWVKIAGESPMADNLKLTLQISYGTADTDQEYISITPDAGVQTLGWTQLSGLFDYSPDRAITDVKVYVEAAGDTTSYYVDDLFITKVFTPNGGLESGNATGWNAAGASIAVTAAQAHSGQNSLHVTGRTATWNSAQYDLLNSGMVPGRSYQISAWIKADGATAADLRMTIELADGDNSDRYFTIAQSSDTLDWVKLSKTYTYAPDGEATVFKVYFESGSDSATSSYYVDDLLITEVIPPINMISNGDLELGSAAGWMANNATVGVTTSAAGVHTGNFGLAVTDRTMNWNSAQYSLKDVGLVEGATYIASVWAKAGGEAADTLFLKQLMDYGSSQQYPTLATSADGADTLSWTKLSGLFTYAPTDEVADVRVYVETAGNTTPYFVDDLIVQRMFTPNGNLESGNSTGWNAAGAQIAVTTDEAFDGASSLHVTGRTADWNSGQYDLLNSGMEAGKTYDISAWVKIDGDTADTIKMTVELVDADVDIASPPYTGTPQYLTIAQSSETSTWVKLSSRYTYAPVGDVTVFKVYFEANGATSSYYIDNLVITEASESYPN